MIDSQGSKRKRIDDSVAGHGGGSAGNITPGTVNYLLKTKGEKLKLLEGDAESFGEILGIIDDYEGIR